MRLQQFNLYIATNDTNGKQYIGITTKSVRRRWGNHLRHARFGSPMKLHAAIRDCGEHQFSVEHIASATSYSALKNAEREAIASYGTMSPNGYNSTVGGQGACGFKFTDEQRERLSQSHTGKRHTLETIEKIKASSTGRKHSECTRKKMSLIRAAAFTANPETYRSGVEAIVKYSKSDQGRARASESMRQLARFRDQTGRKRSEESRRKMSESRKAFFARNREVAVAPVSKLSASQVSEIKRLSIDGMSNVRIAKRYGVATNTIRFIVINATWKWVEPSPVAIPQRG